MSSNSKIIPLPNPGDERVSGSPDEPFDPAGSAGANIIPFPKPAQQSQSAPSNILLFPLAEAGAKPGCAVAGPELPGTRAHSEENAQQSTSALQGIKSQHRRPSARKPAPNRRRPELPQPGTRSTASHGTNGAETSDCMDSATRPDRFERSNKTGGTGVSESQGERDAFRTENSTPSSADALGAMERQEGRPVGSIDRLAPVHPAALAATEPSPTGEQIFFLLFREALLARQSGSDSMTVVLRTDEETELVLHLTQSRDRLHASVRCERGDRKHLRAVWSQVQESMALQRICLAPLQEPLFADLPCEGPAAGAVRAESSAAAAPLVEDDFMDEWPSPAPPESQRHVRRRRSRSRLTTSRPGWETWA
jgi:hypothetical protein